MSTIQKYKVQVFGASTDPVEANQTFSNNNKYNFVLLSDPEKTYAKALGVLNPTGMFAQRWTYVIDDKGIIREIDKSVKTMTHGKDVAAKLEALGVPKK
jgi:peroxiredoxin Q/BCP